MIRKPSKKMILALPKGRLLSDIESLLARADIHPETAFYDHDGRQFRFTTNIPDLDIIRVRAFDVATFVAFGVAQIGIVGLDVLLEFEYPEIYMPLDLNIGHCRLSLAKHKGSNTTLQEGQLHTSISIATKYPQLTKRYCAQRNVRTECIKLNGAVELAINLGLCECIVDLVSTGSTLKKNDLVEVETIAHVTSRLIVNRNALKTNHDSLDALMERFEKATPHHNAIEHTA
ncbi:MAG: ATP phosphoribosyltransferase [Alphaproteobacteria bacterium GM7ARS4]|nr:ATP phosphoribosyltransferase [Alphaproteobacteria bacterium GM7ARS4]